MTGSLLEMVFAHTFIVRDVQVKSPVYTALPGLPLWSPNLAFLKGEEMSPI